MPSPSRELLVPFQVGSTGGIAFTEDPVKQAIQHVLSVIVTGRGERVMRADYGTAVHQALFESNDPLIQADLRSSMEVAVRKWAPDLEVVAVTFTGTDIQQGQMQFNVRFRFVGSAIIHTATISVGGMVTENTLPLVQE